MPGVTTPCDMRPARRPNAAIREATGPCPRGTFAPRDLRSAGRPDDRRRVRSARLRLGHHDPRRSPEGEIAAAIVAARQAGAGVGEKLDRPGPIAPEGPGA